MIRNSIINEEFVYSYSTECHCMQSIRQLVSYPCLSSKSPLHLTSHPLRFLFSSAPPPSALQSPPLSHCLFSLMLTHLPLLQLLLSSTCLPHSSLHTVWRVFLITLPSVHEDVKAWWEAKREWGCGHGAAMRGKKRGIIKHWFGTMMKMVTWHQTRELWVRHPVSCAAELRKYTGHQRYRYRKRRKSRNKGQYGIME